MAAQWSWRALGSANPDQPRWNRTRGNFSILLAELSREFSELPPSSPSICWSEISMRCPLPPIKLGLPPPPTHSRFLLAGSSAPWRAAAPPHCDPPPPPRRFNASRPNAVIQPVYTRGLGGWLCDEKSQTGHVHVCLPGPYSYWKQESGRWMHGWDVAGARKGSE